MVRTAEAIKCDREIEKRAEHHNPGLGGHQQTGWELAVVEILVKDGQ